MMLQTDGKNIEMTIVLHPAISVVSTNHFDDR